MKQQLYNKIRRYSSKVIQLFQRFSYVLVPFFVERSMFGSIFIPASISLHICERANVARSQIGRIWKQLAVKFVYF